MVRSSQLIEQLKLSRHPEGGYYRETYRSQTVIVNEIRRLNFSGPRPLSTSIYFLLTSNEKSLLHRIKSDEIWYYHEGSSLSIYILDDHGLTVEKLGSNVLKGEKFQVTVPANSWFGAVVNEKDSYTLSGCMVAPGFDYSDFDLGKRSELLNLFPDFAHEVKMLTNP